MLSSLAWVLKHPKGSLDRFHENFPEKRPENVVGQLTKNVRVPDKNFEGRSLRNSNLYILGSCIFSRINKVVDLFSFVQSYVFRFACLYHYTHTESSFTCVSYMYWMIGTK